MKEWPSFLEIKGRVRLDAFEKFLQELPMSRSRATMVSQVLPLLSIVIELLVPVFFFMGKFGSPLEFETKTPYKLYPSFYHLNQGLRTAVNCPSFVLLFCQFLATVASSNPFPFILDDTFSRIMRMRICFSGIVRKYIKEDEYLFSFINESENINAQHSFPETFVYNENQN